ncbi:MAG: hypothetical protein AAFV53_04180 [Myxococcota bacterium]
MIPLEMLLGRAGPLPAQAAVTPRVQPLSAWRRPLPGGPGTTVLVAEAFWDVAHVAVSPPAQTAALRQWADQTRYEDAAHSVEHSIDLWKRRLGPGWFERLRRMPADAARSPEEPDAPLWTDEAGNTERAETVQDALERCLQGETLCRIVWINAAPHEALAILTGAPIFAGLWRGWHRDLGARPVFLGPDTIRAVVRRPPGDEDTIRALAAAALCLDPRLGDDGAPFLLWWLMDNHLWRLQWRS